MNENKRLFKEGVSCFKKRFSYNWPLFIVLPCLCGAGIYYVNHMAHRPKFFETISIFVVCSGSDKANLSVNIESHFKEDHLKEVIFDTCSTTDYIFPSKVLSSLYSCDIVLAPKTSFKTLDMNAFLSIDDDLYSNYIKDSNPTYYYENEERIAYLFKGDKDDHYLQQYFVFENSDYYAFINKKSKTIGSYGTNEQYDITLKAFTYLLFEE